MLSDKCHGYMKKYFSFWERLSETEKELMCSNANILHYSAGKVLHGGSEDCVGVIAVISGQLRTYMLSEDGRDITLYRLSEGDVCILSASCVLEAITFDVFTETVEESDILLVSSPVYRRITESNIFAEAFGYKLATERFSDVMWTMQQILFMSFDKRLAIFLSDEMSKLSTDKISLTHEQIAKYMGSAREVVTRMLRYFASEGIVELSRGEIKIKDKKKLRQLIN